MSFKDRLTVIWSEWLKSILLIVLIVSSLRSAVADWNDVPTGSMKPTILEGDRIVVNKLAYDLKVPFTTWRLATWDNPERGDIIVLFSPNDGKRLVKRVVGLPGDEISMQANQLRVNQEAVAYSDAMISTSPELGGPRLLAREQLGTITHPVMITPGQSSSLCSFGPLTVPDGSYFVMGDNRDQSFDSRYFGFVRRSAIVGRATAVAASVNPAHHFKPRWDRFFQPLQ